MKLISTDEMWKQLEQVMTGSKNTKHSTIQEYKALSPSIGLRRAQTYLANAKKWQNNCQSDWAYWEIEGDITLAKALIAIFTRLSKGSNKFPPVIEVSNSLFLMDKQASLGRWAWGINH